MKKIIIALLFLSSVVYATDHTAAGLTQAQIQAAVNAASDGDRVILPAGTNSSFSGYVSVTTDNLTIMGAGEALTNIGWDSGSNSQDPVFWFVGADGFVLQDVHLYGTNDQVTREWLIKVHYSTNWRIHNCHMERSGAACIDCRGYPMNALIDNCTFEDGYWAGHGYGVYVSHATAAEWAANESGDASWTADLDMGTIDGVYIEDCTFETFRHMVATGAGARCIIRYNTFTSNGGSSTEDMFDTHGWINGLQRGTKKYEIYENTINCTNEHGYVSIRDSGDGVMFNNTITNLANPDSYTFILNVPCCSVDCTIANGWQEAYPENDQTQLYYLWGNTLDGGAYNSVTVSGVCANETGAPLFVEGRDWYEYEPSSEIYTAYQYPHPWQSMKFHAKTTIPVKGSLIIKEDERHGPNAEEYIPQYKPTPTYAPRNQKRLALFNKMMGAAFLGWPAPKTDYVPPKFDDSHIFEKTVVDVWPGMRQGPDTPLWQTPASFNWDDQGGVLQNTIQGSCPSCWIMSAVAHLEGAIMLPVDGVLQNSTAQYDLSEESIKECLDWGLRGCYGGSTLGAYAHMTAYGLPLENANANTAYVDDPDPPCDTAGQDRWIVTGYRSVNTATVSAIQDDIYAYGPTPITIDSTPLLTGYTTGCLDQAGDTGDHCVLLVGWDDADTDCTNTGGWVIRNNSGTGWGEDGFFRLDYEDDAQMGSLWRITGFEAYSNHEVRYYYDEGGWQDVIGYSSDTAWGLVMFTATDRVRIEEVQYYSPSNTYSGNVYLYDGFDGTDLGNLLTTQAISAGTRAGFYTQALATPQTFADGATIVVVIEITTTGYNYPLVVDDTDSDNNGIEGSKCYGSADGSSASWTDLSTLGTPADLSLRATGMYGTAEIKAVTPIKGTKIIKEK